MDPRVDDPLEGDIAWLPGERFEIALDAESGAGSEPGAGDGRLTLTSHRAIASAGQPGRRTTSVMSLSGITAIDVVDVSRPTEKLSQGLVILAVGLVLGWVSWQIINVALVSLLVGGLPVLAAVYMLASYAFPDTEGELVLHAGAYALHQPLRSSDARRDAYLVAQRISELISATPSALVAAEPPSPRPVPSPAPPRAEPSASSEQDAKAEPSVRISDAGPPARPRPAHMRPWRPHRPFHPSPRR